MAGTSAILLVCGTALAGGITVAGLFGKRLVGRFFETSHPSDQRDDFVAAYLVTFILGGVIGTCIGLLLVRLL